MTAVRGWFAALIIALALVAGSASIFFLSNVQQSSLKKTRIDQTAIGETIRNSQKAWHVPGVAVGIVVRNRIVYLKGHGVRKIGGKQPVTPDTVFALGSCSKPFATLILALLVHAGILDWDDPVREHLAYFRLADPLADANVTIRDLVTHRTGVGSHDLLWYRAPWSVEEGVRKIAFLEPSLSFRSGMRYQSIMFNAAGLAAVKATGSAWPDLVEKRILVPLRMKRTTLTTAHALNLGDYAIPHHRKENGQIEALPWYKFTEPHPAGSVNSTARDLCNFVKFHLAEGVWEGKRLVSADALLETRSPQVVVPIKGSVREINPFTMQISYGMGWVVQDYRGELLHLHGGAIDGFRAQLTMLPKRGMGIVVLSNLQGTYMNTALTNSLIDQLLGLSYYDWDAHFEKMRSANDAARKKEREALKARRHKNTKPSLPLPSYCGVYRDRAYGDARVTLEKGTLVWHWSSFHAPLEHYHFDTFTAGHKHLVNCQVVFTLGADGRVAALEALDRRFVRDETGS